MTLKIVIPEHARAFLQKFNIDAEVGYNAHEKIPAGHLALWAYEILEAAQRAIEKGELKP